MLPKPQTPTQPIFIGIAKKAVDIYPFASCSLMQYTSISFQRFVHYTLFLSLHYLTLHFSFLHFSHLQQRTATAFSLFIAQTSLIFRSWYLSFQCCFVCSRLSPNYYIHLTSLPNPQAASNPFHLLIPFK